MFIACTRNPKHANIVEVIHALLKRRTLLCIVLVYEKPMACISNNFIEGCVTLERGETTRSKAKKNLFRVLYPEEIDRN